MGSQPVAMRIRIGKQPRLQHLVRREPDAGNRVGRAERRLFDFGEVIVRVAVQLHLANLNEEVFPVRPDLGQIERIVGRRLRIRFGHDLDTDRPFRKFTTRDPAEELLLIGFARLPDDLGGLGIGEMAVTLLGFEMELHRKTPYFCGKRLMT